MKYRIRDTVSLLKTTWKEWNEKDPFRQSAAIAYYAIFSLPALLVVVITFAGWFYGQDEVTGRVVNQVKDMMGPATAAQVKEMLVKAGETKKSVWAMVIGIMTILAGATGVFGELQKSLNIIWEVKSNAKKGIWALVKARLFSFGLVLSFGFLLVVYLVISSALVANIDWF
jgi:membrane protein